MSKGFDSSHQHRVHGAADQTIAGLYINKQGSVRCSQGEVKCAEKNVVHNALKKTKTVCYMKCLSFPIC